MAHDHRCYPDRGHGTRLGELRRGRWLAPGCGGLPRPVLSGRRPGGGRGHRHLGTANELPRQWTTDTVADVRAALDAAHPAAAPATREFTVPVQTRRPTESARDE